MREIFFAGGCFWGTQHYFNQVRGVVSTEVGYANGGVENPTYEQVYTDSTGYAECVKVCYDADVVSLELLTELFFRSIDPLSLNQQGEDVGTRYRTGIYYTSPEDLPAIRSVYDRIAMQMATELAVELCALQNFYSAEEYHQYYLVKNPSGYCHISLELIRAAREANR